MHGVTQNIYCGLYDFSEMFFLLHFLKKEDVFVDVGANVGSYTILASAHVGANSICFEPVPQTYATLLENIYLNQILDLVKPFNVAVGSANGQVEFTDSLDACNHVATQGDLSTISVKVQKLDDLVKDHNPILIKIDVEGYETEVIEGAAETLKNSGLKAIIIELNGSGERYGYDENAIDQSLSNLGFKQYYYSPEEKMLKKSDCSKNSDNALYLMDLNLVENRLRLAEKVKILNHLI